MSAEREAAESVSDVRCYVCSEPYGGPAWIEAVVPDHIWEQINPSANRGGGILCVKCIARRCAERGLINVPVVFTAGPLMSVSN